MGRGAEERRIPLGIDALGADVEANRAALVVLEHDLRGGRLAGKRE